MPVRFLDLVSSFLAAVGLSALIACGAFLASDSRADEPLDNGGCNCFPNNSGELY